MASLLVLIFAVEFAVALVNAIGATTINNLVRSSLLHTTSMETALVLAQPK